MTRSLFSSLSSVHIPFSGAFRLRIPTEGSEGSEGWFAAVAIRQRNIEHRTPNIECGGEVQQKETKVRKRGITEIRLTLRSLCCLLFSDSGYHRGANRLPMEKRHSSAAQRLGEAN
jgi:hypothetical protein